MLTLEQRVSALESQVRQLLEKQEPPKSMLRWERIVGSFADSEGFEEAVRLGREYREAQRPSKDEDAR